MLNRAGRNATDTPGHWRYSCPCREQRLPAGQKPLLPLAAEAVFSISILPPPAAIQAGQQELPCSAHARRSQNRASLKAARQKPLCRALCAPL